MKKLILAGSLLLLTVTGVRAEPSREQKILTAVTTKAALLGVANNISVYYLDLSDGTKVEVNSGREWAPASLIKVLVAAEAYRQKQVGLINFDQKVIINPKNVVPTALETYEFPDLKANARLTLRDLVEAMITQSDNTAYNTLLDILDRRNVAVNLKRLNLLDTTVGEKLSLDESQVSLELDVHGRQSNKTTARDMGIFFQKLYLQDVSYGSEMLNLLKRQKINYMLPRFLPAGVTVAHKTGESAPYFHDGGVIYKPGHPYVLVVMTDAGNPDIVAQLSREVYYADEKKVLGISVANLWAILQDWWARLR